MINLYWDIYWLYISPGLAARCGSVMMSLVGNYHPNSHNDSFPILSAVSEEYGGVSRYLSIRGLDSIKIDSAQLTDSLGSEKRHLQFYNFTANIWQQFLARFKYNFSWLDNFWRFQMCLMTRDSGKYQTRLPQPCCVSRYPVVVGGGRWSGNDGCQHDGSITYAVTTFWLVSPTPSLGRQSAAAWQQLVTAGWQLGDSWVTRPPFPVAAPTASQAGLWAPPAPALTVPLRVS